MRSLVFAVLLSVSSAFPLLAQWLPIDSVSGAAAGAGLGSSLATGGDYDGDGLLDIAIAASGSGSVFIYTAVVGLPLIATLTGAVSDEFGAKLAFVEIDGSPGSELVVGSPGANSNLGRVQVFDFSSATVTFNGSSSGGRLGAALAAGDFDNDGVEDLACGAPGSDEVLILESIPGGLAVTCTIVGPSGTEFGFSLAAGDLDGLGTLELVIGAPNEPIGVGVVSVYDPTSCTLLCSVTGPAGAGFGHALAVVGSLAASLTPGNILVGSPLHDTGGLDAGAVVVVDGGCMPVCTLIGDAGGDLFGAAVAGVTSLDGDAFHEFVVGAPGSDVNGADSGIVTLFSGGSNCLSGLCARGGSAPGDRYGSDVADAGDLNADGAKEGVFSAPGSDSGGLDSGLVEFVTMLNPITSYGVSGGSLPVLSVTGIPAVGGLISLVLSANPSLTGLPGGILASFAPQVPGIPVPPSGFILVDLTAPTVFSVLLSGAGAASVPVAIPAAPILVGLTFFSQAFVIDPFTPLGFSLTQGVQVLILPAP